MSTLLVRKLYKSLVQSTRRLDKEWKRGARILSEKDEINSFFNDSAKPYCDMKSPVVALDDDNSKSLTEYLKQRFRATPFSLANMSMGFTALRDVQTRLNTLSQINYKPYSVTVTNDLSIEVKSFFIQTGQTPYKFLYEVKIKNYSPTNTHQVLKRKWSILSGDGERIDVEGDGVVGRTPVLAPGQEYSYQSSADLSTYFGTMWGHYGILDHTTGQEWIAQIQPFGFVPDHPLNER